MELRSASLRHPGFQECRIVGADDNNRNVHKSRPAAVTWARVVTAKLHVAERMQTCMQVEAR